MGICRSCGKSIHWIELKSGKMMPCDDTFITPAEANIGDVLVTESGRVVQVDKEAKYAEAMCGVHCGGYVSHFSTCPQAGEWRKPKNLDNKEDE